jgi:CBS domain-containing protein
VLVRDLIKRKGSAVTSAPPGTTVAALLDLLAEHRIGAVVVSADGGVDGIVSERDVVRALRTAGTALLDAPISTVMTADVVVTSPGDTVEDMMRLMTERRIRHVPVVADGRIAGIISIGDVVKSRIDELEADRDQLIGYIHSSR